QATFGTGGPLCGGAPRRAPRYARQPRSCSSIHRSLSQRRSWAVEHPREGHFAPGHGATELNVGIMGSRAAARLFLTAINALADARPRDLLDAPPVPTVTTRGESGPPTIGAPRHSGVGAVLATLVTRLVGRPAFWGVAIGFLFAWPVGSGLMRRVPKPPPILGTVPDFRLRDQSGAAFGSDQLRDRIWVVDFIATGTSICGKLTGKMGEVQHRSRNLGNAFHMVS